MRKAHIHQPLVVLLIVSLAASIPILVFARGALGGSEKPVKETAGIPFMRHLILASHGGVGIPNVVDLNHDGLLDIVGSGIGSQGQGAWLENKGENETSFTVHYIPDAWGIAYSFPADLDGDGNTDLAVTDGYATQKLGWLKNDGLPHPGFGYNLIAEGGSGEIEMRNISAADLDNDGDNDLIAGFGWFENDPESATFTLHTIDSPSHDPYLSIAVVDMNGDGRVDIASKHAYGRVSWCENAGGSPVSFVEHSLYEQSSSHGPAAVDIDEDGDYDIVVHSDYDLSLAWFQNDGTGNLTHHLIKDSSYPVQFADAIDVADLDGDGDKDIVFGGYSGAALGLGWMESHTGGQGSGVPTSFTGHPIDTAQILWIKAVDLDGDGDVDILASAMDGLYLYENLTLQATPTPTPTPPPVPTPTPPPVPTPTPPPVPTPTPQPTVNPAQLDLNHDGIINSLDLLLFQSHWHETSYE